MAEMKDDSRAHADGLARAEIAVSQAQDELGR